MGIYLSELCTEETRRLVGVEAGPWLIEKRFIISLDGDKKAVGSSFGVFNSWLLAITVLSLTTSSWPCYLLGRMRHVGKLFSSVNGYCCSSSLLGFMVLPLKMQDGQNKWSAQYICPRSFISMIITLSELVNPPSSNKFSSKEISYLLQRQSFLRSFYCSQLLL